VDLKASVELGAPPERVRPLVASLDCYPQWLSIVAKAEPLDGTVDAWAIELRAKVGPLSRSKRLRMVRTVDDPLHLRFERIEGHWTGDLGINTIVSFGTLLIALIVGFLLTWPDPPGISLFIMAISIAGFVPLVFFPFSKTIWLAIDLIFRPLEPGEVARGYGPQRGESAERPVT
jgi:hypothetical protein